MPARVGWPAGTRRDRSTGSGPHVQDARMPAPCCGAATRATSRLSSPAGRQHLLLSVIRRAPGSEGFLLWALRSQGMQRQFDLTVKGTTFREITLAQLRLLLVPVPTRRQEQDRIALCMQLAVDREESEIAYRDKLRSTKVGLIEDLLTDGMRVTKLVGSAAE
jgi:hypothetical protein